VREKGEGSLPIIVKCSKCNYILYQNSPKSFVFDLIKWKNGIGGGSSIWLHQLIYKYNNKCPKCQKQLKLPPKQIIIKDPVSRLEEKVKIK